MSTLSILYKSFSGLQSFSHSLNNLSHNVANINTPGFKGTSVHFRDMLSDQNKGGGVHYTGETLKLTQGDISRTGQDSHLAIDGKGWFVLTDGEREYFTRAGQFEFDQWQLVDKSTGYKVLGIRDGSIQNLNLNHYNISSPQSTTSIQLKGNLNAGAATGTKVPAEGEEKLEAVYFNKLGEKHTLYFSFTKKTGNEWTVAVKKSETETLATHTIKFNGNGSPHADSANLSVKIDDNQSIKLNIGQSGTFANLTGYSSANSSVAFNAEDGREAGQVKGLSFDHTGKLSVEYTNGDKQDTLHVLLANLPNDQYLTSVGNSMFAYQERSEIVYGHGGQKMFGTIKGGSIEKSNVNMSHEFSEIIIVQRGYQASSQVLSVTNKMIEELYNSARGK